MTTTTDFTQSLEAQVNNLIETYTRELVNKQVYQINKQVTERVEQILRETISQCIEHWDFPESSIPLHSLDLSEFSITTSSIQDYRKLSGIEDLSKQVELTLMDGVVVAENSVVTKEVVTDNLEVTQNLKLSDLIFNNIKDRIASTLPTPPQYDQEIKNLNERLDSAVHEAKKFDFKELEVTGEALLSDVLYTSPGNKRVGINTMDPSDALTVWDQETEVVIGKHKAQEGYIGTRRRQNLSIGANNKVGLTIKHDGTVAMNKLELMGKVISSSKSVPGHAAKTGDIVLNNKPLVGNCIGWVCLDGIKWSGFGKIQE